MNNAAELGVSRQEENAIAHVRFMPHRRGAALDVVVVADQGPGIRETLARNPRLDVPEADAEAIRLATQELVSGLGFGVAAGGSLDALPAGPDVAVSRHAGTISLCDGLAQWGSVSNVTVT